MSGLLPDVDPDGLLEYSVVYTDRALNHMSRAFQTVMTDLSATLKRVYAAEAAVIVPGSGTFGMESVARQFATGQAVMVIRNGWFSYRWSQIFAMGDIPASEVVHQARRQREGAQVPFAPAPIEEVEASIAAERPALVFAPHVETASGMLLPDDYIRRLADAVHAVGGLLVLDCIASGTLWVDMQATGVDVLISAPQKGWSGTPCCAMVMLSARGRERLEATTSSSFAMDLGKWHAIMQAYEQGGHAYHATLPTDGLRRLRDIMEETERVGFARVRDAQLELGRRVRELLAARGFVSVAAEGFAAPGVVVSYTEDAGIAAKFMAAGLQVAAGVPLQCGEGDDFRTFRIGLFGLDKLLDVERSVASLAAALDQLD